MGQKWPRRNSSVSRDIRIHSTFFYNLLVIQITTSFCCRRSSLSLYRKIRVFIIPLFSVILSLWGGGGVGILFALRRPLSKVWGGGKWIFDNIYSKPVHMAQQFIPNLAMLTNLVANRGGAWSFGTMLLHFRATANKNVITSVGPNMFSRVGCHILWLSLTSGSCFADGSSIINVVRWVSFYIMLWVTLA